MNEQLVKTLKQGNVAVMSTDTVYGLVCSAAMPEAVSEMYKVKGRDGKPGTIVAASAEHLVNMGFIDDDIVAAQKFWPGPTSVILAAPERLEHLHLGLNSLAVRITADSGLRSLLELTGPLATTSANLPGEPTVTDIEEAKKVFGDKVSLYVDGGYNKSKPSAVVKIINGNVIKLR